MNPFARPEWAAYVLECGDGTLYTGVTNDLVPRLSAHEAGAGAKYTRGRGPLRVRRVEFFDSKGEALRMELAIKKLSRAAKLALCADSSHGAVVAASSGGAGAEAVLSEFREESAPHRPRVGVSISWDGKRLSGTFVVENDYAKAEPRDFNAPVYRDSCVEFFSQPEGAAGYFNFEWNAAGAMLAGYVTDPAREGGRVVGQILFNREECAAVEVAASPGGGKSAKGDAPTDWSLTFAIPFEILRGYAEFGEVRRGAVWRGNFYKCGDSTAKPHWASWRPLPERNFHLPDSFGYIVFG